LVVDLLINGDMVSFATVHLESLSNRSTRKQQLEIIHEKFLGNNNVFFMGDMNIDASINYEQLKQVVNHVT